jgi:hypothetical protein
MWIGSGTYHHNLFCKCHITHHSHTRTRFYLAALFMTFEVHEGLSNT